MRKSSTIMGWFAIAWLLSVVSASAEEPALTPDAAKAALLKLMRSEQGKALPSLDDDAFDKISKMKIGKGDEGWYSWSAFRFHPGKGIYTLTIAPAEGSPACTFSYEGTFQVKDGNLEASVPKLQSTARPASSLTK